MSVDLDIIFLFRFCISDLLSKNFSQKRSANSRTTDRLPLQNWFLHKHILDVGERVIVCSPQNGLRLLTDVHELATILQGKFLEKLS